MKRDAFESSIPEEFTKDISLRGLRTTIAVFVGGTWKVVQYLGDDAKPDAIEFYKRYGFESLDVLRGPIGERPAPQPIS